MNKKIIRIAAIASLATMIMAGFVSCKKTECDICGEEHFCSKKEVLGEEIYICGDCEDELNDIADELKG